MRKQHTAVYMKSVLENHLLLIVTLNVVKDLIIELLQYYGG